jgi:hypothetical protein
MKHQVTPGFQRARPVSEEHDKPFNNPILASLVAFSIIGHLVVPVTGLNSSCHYNLHATEHRTMDIRCSEAEDKFT